MVLISLSGLKAAAPLSMDRLLFPVRKPQNERGVYLLEHQAGPDLHDLPLVLGDPESGEEGLEKEFWSMFYAV